MQNEYIWLVWSYYKTAYLIWFFSGNHLNGAAAFFAIAYFSSPLINLQAILVTALTTNVTIWQWCQQYVS